MIWILAAFAGPIAFENQDTSFLSYTRIPTWTGVASALDEDTVRVDLYDSKIHKGHADFASKGLGTGITFKQFKAAVKDDGRRYMPFFLYDLRGQEPTVDGRERDWAVRFEDYGYVDSPTSLGTDITRVAEAVAKHTGFDKDAGIIVLAHTDRVRPNQAEAPTVTGAGWDHATLGRIRKGEGVPYEVLNPGTALGTLRYHDPEAPFALQPTDIVVYRGELPARIPPVAGILTLAPQTPLSHVNLLARNRGTPNVHVRSLALLDAKPGDTVRLDASTTFALTKVEAAVVEAHWADRKTTALAIPKADRSIGIVSFADRIPTVSEVGAKAANYARLRTMLPDLVRPGHALGFQAYFAHLQRGDAQKQIDALLAEVGTLDGAALDARLKQIREAIRATPLDRTVLADTKALLESDYAGRRVRLRSSTNNEDLPRFNGAGLYRSKGFDVGDSAEKLEKKMKTVFASLWSSHAFAERSFYGVDHREVGMALLIHEAFPGEAANGVVLTVPHDGRVDVVVNANPGEFSVTNPEDGHVPEQIRFPLGDPAQAEVRGASTIGPVFAEGAFARGLLTELAAATATIQAAFADPQRARDGIDYGVDIEFKVMHSPEGLKLFVKQARLLAPPSPE